MQRCPGIAHWQFLILSSAYQLDPPYTESAWYHKMWRSVAMFGSKQGLGGVSLFCPFNLVQVVDNGNGGDKDMAFCIKFSWRLLIFMTFQLVGWSPNLHIRVKWVLFDRLSLFSSHWHVTNSSHCLRRSLFPRKAKSMLPLISWNSAIFRRIGLPSHQIRSKAAELLVGHTWRGTSNELSLIRPCSVTPWWKKGWW